MSATPPPVAEHIAPDVSELGALTAQQQRVVRMIVPTVSNALSFIFFVLLVAGAAQSDIASNALAGCTVGLWVTANFLRRVAPRLWSEEGKITYARVSTVNAVHAPRTLKGQLSVYTLLLDAVALPLVMAFGAFHRVFVFSIVGSAMYPPLSDSSVPLVLFFVVFPLLGVAASTFAYAVVLPRDRVDPYFYQKHSGWPYLPMLSAVAALGLSLPAMTWSTAPLACDGKKLRFSGGMRCQGAGHHVLVLFAGLLLHTYSCFAEMATSYLELLNPPSFVPLHQEPRNDALYLEIQLVLRWIVVIVASLSTHAAAFIVVTVLSGAVLAFLLSGKSRYLPSSVAVLKDLYVAMLMQLFATSAVLFVLGCVGATGWFGVLMWLVLWALSLSVCVYFFARGNGRQLFEQETADVTVSST